MQDPLFGQLGNTGAAFAPMLLVAALENAQARRHACWSPATATAPTRSRSRVTDAVEALARPARRALAPRAPRRARRLRQVPALPPASSATEHDRRAGAGVSATIHFRDRDEDISLHGQQCRKCGQEQFPFQRVCFTCFARTSSTRCACRIATGKVLSLTFDFFAGSPDPPLIVTMIEVEGGARLYLQMTDASPKEVKLDLPVEFTFRKIHEYGGTPNYFWKCTPVR